LSRYVVAWYLATQAAAVTGIHIIRAALALSALAGVIAAGSTLHLRLHNKQEHKGKKQNKLLSER
jgi:Na+-transporting NADH:ubiquinone oxidoreductase subunit NqrC